MKHKQTSLFDELSSVNEDFCIIIIIIYSFVHHHYIIRHSHLEKGNRAKQIYDVEIKEIFYKQNKKYTGNCSGH